MGSKLFKRKRSKFEAVREERKKARDVKARENALAKRRKLNDGTSAATNPNFEPLVSEFDADQDHAAFDGDEQDQNGDSDNMFYGLLSPDEQAYYTNVNNKITTDDFESSEERDTFVEAVYRESKDKELKLASSQSCSRHLEKLIMISSPSQLRSLFEALMPGIVHLSQHRFGSHVLETLFLQTAKYVPADPPKSKSKATPPSPLESLFLAAAEELHPNMGYMMTDRFASHTIRVLLLVLSGEALDDSTTQTMLASKKKETIHVKQNTEASEVTRAVPKSFHRAMINLLEATISSLDTTYLRALATHPTGSPVLQLILRLELLGSDKGRQLDENSVYRKLLSPDELGTDSEGDKFVSGLTYDATGSHLIEVLVRYSPGRTFKKLYRGVWKARMTSMAKNDIASYVAVRILERLGQQELVEVRGTILTDLRVLLERRRYNVLQTIIERSVARRTELEPIAESLRAVVKDGNDTVLTMLLDQTASTEDQERKTSEKDSKLNVRGSLLIQGMLTVPVICTVLQEDLISLDDTTICRMAIEPSGSRTLQTALTSSQSPTSFRRALISKLADHVKELGTDQYGSYVIDAIWNATFDLHFIKERTAQKIASHESDFRDSSYGRNVWRNWQMDTYQRRRVDWHARAKGMNGAVEGRPDNLKTPMQLALERHAAAKLAKKNPNHIRSSRTLSTTA